MWARIGKTLIGEGARYDTTNDIAETQSDHNENWSKINLIVAPHEI